MIAKGGYDEKQMASSLCDAKTIKNSVVCASLVKGGILCFLLFFLICIV